MHSHVSKALFLDALSCPTRAWRALHADSERGDDDPDFAERWQRWQGNDVGRRARALLGTGPLLRSGEIAAAERATADALQDATLSLVFEATFTWQGCVARADALRRVPDGWEVIEVKPGKTSDPVKEKDRLTAEYVDDLAYTVMVARGAGLPVVAASLMLIDRDWRLELADARPLMVTRDATAAVVARAAKFSALLPKLSRLLLGDREPSAALTIACRDCQHFAVDCLGVGIEDHLFVLPRLSEKRLDALAPYERISRVPRSADLTATQRRVAAAIWGNAPVVDAAVLARLDGLQWPLRFLDFETVSVAVPWFPSTPPHQQVPFQYSLHVQGVPGGALTHQSHLADVETDWRRVLADRLIFDLGSTGSILSYSPFEAQVLKGLGEMLPDLQGACDALIARIVDLEPIVREGWVHPGFRGRTTIKQVLPVVDPTLSHATLAIGDGSAASAAFALMRVGEVPEASHAGIRADLLTYCEQDTLAMVKVYDALRAVRG